MTDRVQYSSYTLEWPYSHTWRGGGGGGGGGLEKGEGVEK